MRSAESSASTLLPRASPHARAARRWVDQVSRVTLRDPTYEYGVQQLLAGNVYVVIGTARYPQGELSGHAVLGRAAPS